MHKPEINIVWFKRDLRLQDHLPLQMAVATNKPVLLLYFYEPTVMQYGDSDERHWCFVQESLADMNAQLRKYHVQILAICNEVIDSFKRIQHHYTIQRIFSHEETGNALTYKRDKQVAVFCKQENIEWIEAPANGIVRKLYNRKHFSERWLSTMSAPIYEVALENIQSLHADVQWLPQYTTVHVSNALMQPGGVTAAQKYLHSFLYERKQYYSKHISKPELSRKSCSRLSPYLAWGNISMKQVYQASIQAINDTGDKRNIYFFMSRLHWHCHFIQKFETECRMEFENLNTGFNTIRKVVNDTYVKAWQEGKTGYPLIDACIQCVRATGYLNFRMRSTLVSFFTHHLWQPWQAGVHFLAKQFLDYEPGIHYPQFQMQAGTMGVNTIRIYNPVKQSVDHDAEGVFIKKWLPVLNAIPTEHVHKPWLMTTAEQLMYGIVLGKDYPLPIVDIEVTGKYAREHLWAVKKSKDVQKQNERILHIHTKRKTEKEDSLQLPLTFNKAHENN
jgi:deoxyribodipyrimidine photo-lyase